MAWLASAILGTELLICIKYGKGMYPNPWPSHIVLIWSVALGSFAIFSIVYWGYWVRRNNTKEKSQ